VVNIQITPAFVLPDGIPATAFTLELGGGYTPAVNMTQTGDTLRQGSAWTPNVRVGETLSFDDVVFQGVVETYRGGGASDATFIPRLLYLMYRNILQVQQDNAAPMTPAQVLNYIAP